MKYFLFLLLIQFTSNPQVDLQKIAGKTKAEVEQELGKNIAGSYHIKAMIWGLELLLKGYQLSLVAFFMHKKTGLIRPGSIELKQTKN